MNKNNRTSSKCALYIVFALAVVFIMCPRPAHALCGDVSGDGAILSNDILMVARAALGTLTLDSAQKARADVVITGTPDGNILSNDLLLIARASLGIVQLSCASSAASTLTIPSGATATSLDLSWTQNGDSDFASYKIYRSTTSGVTQSSTLVDTITAKNTTSKTVSGLSAATKYYFKVYVCNTASQCTGGNEVNGTTTAAIIYSYIYFKRNGTTTPQTATIDSNGVLSIDGKTISGIYHAQGGGITFLGGGSGTTVLSGWWSPADNPLTMFLCGPDPVTAAPDTLLYVLFDSPDANRVSATAASFLNALQSETQYIGANVYTNCSGWADTSWIRDYPKTSYYLWPDVFSSYSAAYVSGLLSDAVIYSTPAAGNNYKQYVAVRVTGTVFEVWH